jgi:hypothetical protein
MKIDAIAGDFRYSFRVFGDRHWAKRHGRLTPSYPEPFTEMPLILENAYGGSVTQEWGELAWIHNPKGKGYYATEEQALGGPLPNIEIDEQLIESHTDQPTPFAPCIYPLDGGLRVAGMDPMQPDVGLRETGHLFLCWAHPNMMMTTELSKGDPIRVSGILESGLFAASVPSLDAEGYVQYGEETKPFDFRCDTVIVQGESQRITFRWRSAMTFPLSPREKRVVYLVNKQGVQVSP